MYSKFFIPHVLAERDLGCHGGVGAERTHQAHWNLQCDGKAALFPFVVSRLKYYLAPSGVHADGPSLVCQDSSRGASG